MKNKTWIFFFFTGHPRFFNQLSCGLDIVSMAGEWLTATANTNMFTYEIAPVFILMESVVLSKMREIIGWKGGDSIFAPGRLLVAILQRYKTKRVNNIALKHWNNYNHFLFPVAGQVDRYQICTRFWRPGIKCSQDTRNKDSIPSKDNWSCTRPIKWELVPFHSKFIYFNVFWTAVSRAT